MYKNDEFASDILSLQGLRVLVVDNNVDCCDLIELLLQFYGVEVRKAFLVQQALEILVEWQPDILVSEILWPNGDGIALIQQAKTIAAERKKELLSIAVTAYIGKEMCQRALSSGFDFWFAKPLDLNDFVTVLAYWAIDQLSPAIDLLTGNREPETGGFEVTTNVIPIHAKHGLGARKTRTWEFGKLSNFEEIAI